MRSIHERRPQRYLASALVLAAALATSACQNKTAGLDSLDAMNTASTAKPSFTATAALGKKWQADTANIDTGLAYANGLEALGQIDQQMQVLKTLSASHPENTKLQALYGKKLLAAGRAGDAIAVLEGVAASGNADWRLLSALGSAYDQQGRYVEARAQYGKALQLAPGEITVLNNMGMSHALEGDLKQAETTLRQASMLPEAASEPRIRQNLALVVGLQGRFDEAEKIARADLPPSEAEANVGYLREMLAQQGDWKKKGGKPVVQKPNSST